MVGYLLTLTPHSHLNFKGHSANYSRDRFVDNFRCKHEGGVFVCKYETDSRYNWIAATAANGGVEWCGGINLIASINAITPGS